MITCLKGLLSEPRPCEYSLSYEEAVGLLPEPRRCLAGYSRRGRVEELHKTQKTGCPIEQQLFTTASRLAPVIAILSVAAVKRLRMRNAARRPETRERAALEHFPAIYVDALAAWRRKALKGLTVGEFHLALARLGGHQNRKRDHPPSWRILWRGRKKLGCKVSGAKAAAQTGSG